MVPSAALVLRCVRGVGSLGYHRAVARAGSAEAALAALSDDLRTSAQDLALKMQHAADASSLAVLASDDPGYPAPLLQLEDPPPVLFARGNLGLLQRAAVAIVGTREATPYGVRISERLARGVADRGAAVISGMARGVDTVAHRAALRGRGSTIGVLGTGADVVYPIENADLFAEVVASGLLVSEYLPGAKAHPGSFPRRNRIIAALADVVVVVEAGAKSGALITAGVAVSLGKIHAAVPGPVDLPTSVGSNALVRDGAQVVTGVDDVLGLLALTPRGRAIPTLPPRDQPDAPAVGVEDSAVLDLLAHGPRYPDELLGATGLSARVLAGVIASLTVQGLVAVEPSGLVRLVA